MNRILIAAAALLLWTVAVFVAGWQVRDGSADTTVAKAEAKSEGARADVAEGARKTDQAGTRTASAIEQGRIEASARTESNFNTIKQEANRYADDHPTPSPGDVSCGPFPGRADDDFMRIWQAANANATDPGPTRPADAAATGSPGAATTRKP